MNTKCRRLPWIDDMKMVAMMAIILGHSYSYLHGTKIEGATLVQNVLISFAIPMFMFVAGITSYSGATRCETLQDLIVYIEKITLRLGVPNFLFTNITGLVQNVHDSDWIKGGGHFAIPFLCVGLLIIKEKNKGCLFASRLLLFVILVLAMLNKMTDFWFLRNLMQTLVLLACSTWITRKVGIDKGYWFLIPFVAMMVIYPSSFSGTLEFVLYFLVGGLLRQFIISDKGRITKALRKRSTSIFGLSLMLFFAVYSFFLLNFHDFYNYDAKFLFKNGSTEIFIFRQLCALSWIGFWTILLINLSKDYTVFSKWGSQTLGLYVVHVTFVCIPAIYGLHVNIASAYGWLIYILIAVLLTILSLVAIELITKSPYGYIFWGLNKKTLK